MAQGILNTPREVTHQRIAAALEAIEQNMSDEHEAVNIDYDNTYSGLSADNVQEAIDELVNEKANTADLGTASAKDFTTSVTQGSTDLVTSGAVYSEFANLPKPEIFKGTLGVNGTITSLPTASSSNEGWEYKVITDGTYAGQPAKYGDTFISDGTQWVHIPSGDETDTDTWRGINVNGSQLLGSGISSGNVNFKGGTNAQVSGSGNDVTIDVDTTFSDASSRTNIASGDSIKTILGKIKKWFSDLKTVAFSGSYNDLDNKPTIPSVGDGTLKIQKNGSNVATFSANQSGNVTVNIQCVDTVDSFMSDSSTNPLQNKVITKELEGTKTTSGNPLTIEDAAPVNAVNLSMDLEPVQDLHGYDHPWVGGAGKNKLPLVLADIKAANTSGTWSGNVYTLNGVTFEVKEDDNGYVTEIKTNGTATDNILYFRIAQNISVASPLIFSTGYTDTWNVDGHVMEMATDGASYSPYDVSGVEVPAGTYNLRIALTAGRAINNNYKPMLRPTTVSDYSYEPYSNICPISGRTEEVITQKDNPTNPTVTKTYTIQLGDTIYGGELDVLTGKLRVTHGMYDMPSTDWLVNTVNPTCWILEHSAPNSINVTNQDTEVRIITDFLKGITAKNIVDTIFTTGYENTIAIITDSRYLVKVEKSIFATKEDFMAYISANSPKAVYELATPFTIDLTPQQIKMLENTNTIYTDYEGDTIHIEYQPNNAIGEAVRVVEESYDPKFAVRPVLKKKAFSGTTDTDGSVTLINASDIPSNHRIIPLHITDMTIDGNAGTYFVEYEPYNSGDSVKGYCYFYMSGSQMFPVGKAITGNFYYYELEG